MVFVKGMVLGDMLCFDGTRVDWQSTSDPSPASRIPAPSPIGLSIALIDITTFFTLRYSLSHTTVNARVDPWLIT
eukprot:6174127-Pleurochrysis_carterae.AAC.2